MIYRSDEEARKWCEVYQRHLRLQDWTVDVKIVRQHEMPGKLANIGYNLEHKTAMIHLLEPGDYTTKDTVQENPLDHEEDLVHELLHLHTKLILEAAPRHLNNWLLEEEQVINQLSTAIVGLRRRGEASPIEPGNRPSESRK